jgi:hypothetical protein
MSEKLNLLQRLQAVMNEPGADYIQKSQKKINGQYTAVSHDAVARKLHPLFKKHGVIVMPSVMPETVRMVDTGRKTSKSNPISRFEAVFAVTFFNADDPSDKVTACIPAHADDEGDKAPGKALSYATKGALLKALMIESGDEEEERVDGESGGESGDSDRSTTSSSSAMDAAERAALLKQMAEAASKEQLTAIFKSAMNAAKEANDSDAAAAFKAASIARAEQLNNPEAQTVEAPAAEAPAPASAAIIKTLRKSMEKKGADDKDVLAAIKVAGKGVFSKLDAISNEAAIYVMNDYLKTLENAGA